jgi:hypothetical protein
MGASLTLPSSAKNSHSSKFAFPPSTVDINFTPSMKKASIPKAFKTKIPAAKPCKLPPSLQIRDSAYDNYVAKKISSDSDSDPRKLSIQAPKTTTN